MGVDVCVFGCVCVEVGVCGGVCVCGGMRKWRCLWWWCVEVVVERLPNTSEVVVEGMCVCVCVCVCVSVCVEEG